MIKFVDMTATMRAVDPQAPPTCAFVNTETGRFCEHGGSGEHLFTSIADVTQHGPPVPVDVPVGFFRPGVSAYKIEKTHVDTYIVRGPGLDGAAPVWDDEAAAMRCRIVLEHAYAAGISARDTHELGRHDPTMECVDANPAIRCTPSTGCVFRTSAGLVLTIDPLDGGDCPTVNLADVSEWLADNDPRPGAPLRGEDARRLVESLENRCSPEEAARRVAWAKVASAEMLLPPSKRRLRQT